MNINDFKNMFNDCELTEDKIIIKEKLNDAVKLVKNDLAFDLLKSITAVDLSDGNIELNYHLYSTVNEEDLILSIVVNNEAESITDLFDSAVADENEIYDMFGVNFLNNEDLKRLYMPENWEGHPLRKDYVQDDTRLAWNDSQNAEA